MKTLVSHGDLLESHYLSTFLALDIKAKLWLPKKVMEQGECGLIHYSGRPERM
jgi:hypothetical protein